MKASHKALVAVLLVAGFAAAVRVGVVGYDLYEARRSQDDYQSQGAAGAVDNRFKPSAQVLELLNRTDAAAPTLDGSFPCVFEVLAEPEPHPQLGRCPLPTGHSGPVDRFEVDLRYGNFVLRQSDLYLEDIFDVPLTRSYNSGDYLNRNRVHAFGKNTNHPYDIAPVGTRFPYTMQMLVLEDGDFLYFPRVSEGTGYADAVFQHTETSTEFYRAVTAWNGNGWTTWRTDGFAIAFPEAYSAKNAAQGATAEMRDADGNRLKLIRDQQRNLLEIRTPHAHSIKFKYDDQSRIVRAEDDQGNWAEYRYDANGMLTDVTLSSGKRRHYSYDGDLMTTIEDENHRILLRNAYTGRLLTGQDFGNGQVYSYSYTGSASGTYAESVDVKLPDGTKTSIELASSIPAVIKQPSQ